MGRGADGRGGRVRVTRVLEKLVVIGVDLISDAFSDSASAGPEVRGSAALSGEAS